MITRLEPPVTVGEHVPLDRTFSPLHKTDRDAESHEIVAYLGGQKPIRWDTVEKSHRSVILAGAGIGKTHEMKIRAEAKRQAGHVAFFIRIEDIMEDFEHAFEVGDAEDFHTWLASSDEAWFYLDSIDEARLKDPRTFEKAVRRFANRIKVAHHRAHVVISSRPYAWRSHSDYVMVRKHLPFAMPKNGAAETDDADDHVNEILEPSEETSTADESLRVFVLNDLTEKDILAFAEARGVQDADRLVVEIERRDLVTVGARPFDLESIIEKWKDDGNLESRFAFLNYSISKRLAEINPDRDRQQPLNHEQARAGARSLAAAVVLTGNSGIRVPDEHPLQDGVDASVVLSDWHPKDVHTLLERGVFDDVIYGEVRFRHREVRELLAAEWLAEHLRTGNSRRAVEALIFREKYGHRFIAPRLRPLLPWLILLDEGIRTKAFSLSPEIIAEGGDPSRLPLEERQQLLDEIVGRIAAGTSQRTINGIDAIARIAQPDLSKDALRLIDRYRKNDAALYFLGALVWQGEMSECVEPMAEIASDSGSGVMARIAALRSISRVGSNDDLNAVWDRVIANEQKVSRRLAANIVRGALSNSASVERLSATLERLEHSKQDHGSGWPEALHQFIDGFEIEHAAGQQDLARLIQILNEFLEPESHTRGSRKRISRSQIWLLQAAGHAAGRLIDVRSMHALQGHTIAILHKISSARYWHDADLKEHAERLQKAVPDWPELNDTVFWSAISAERARREADGGKHVTDPFNALFYNYCRYEGADFERVLKFIPNLTNEDDGLVAATLAYRLCKETANPERSLAKLRDEVEAIPAVSQHLESMVNWRPSGKERARGIRLDKAKRKHRRKEAIEAEHRRRWVEALKANPALVHRPASVKPGQMTKIQHSLLHAVEKGDSSRWRGDNWRSLTNTFGNEVATEYRNASMEHWRHYVPALASEGSDVTGIPNSLIFGLAGLEIESEQVAGFPTNLNNDELELAMRYAPWELNGFPTWLEKAFYASPEIVTHAMLQELAWDLGRDEASKPYMLHDIAYYAPWLHAHIANWVIDWLEANTARNTEILRQAIYIAKSTANINRLKELARAKSEEPSPVAQRSKWFALWVDTDVEPAIQRLEDWLGSMPPEEASTAAQHFITELIGDRRGEYLGTDFDSYRAPAYIMQIYVLMHRYIKVDEDIERVGSGAFSPELRDDAQDTRDGLFNVLRDIPGRQTFLVLQELGDNHPSEAARSWMLRSACERAEKDGDVEDWSDDQLRDFDSSQFLTPETNAQLFSLALQKLIDMRAWLEDGDDSPYQTWQRVEAETEMRNLITGRLNDFADRRYECAQENEMPNAQRPDIWVMRPGITPVPIELKILDNGWTGPDLCERLRNQLAGDYLRAEGGGRGIMLLVWQGRAKDRKWEVGGRRVDLDGLEAALQGYWRSISTSWPGIDEVRVIVINLTRRGLRSAT